MIRLGDVCFLLFLSLSSSCECLQRRPPLKFRLKRSMRASSLAILSWSACDGMERNLFLSMYVSCCLLPWVLLSKDKKGSKSSKRIQFKRKESEGSQLLHHFMFGFFCLQNVLEFGAGKRKTREKKKKKKQTALLLSTPQRGDEKRRKRRLKAYSIPRSTSGMAVSMPDDNVTLDSSNFFSGA